MFADDVATLRSQLGAEVSKSSALELAQTLPIGEKLSLRE
jgi:hypothetical protein